jgi:hypothetical protein
MARGEQKAGHRVGYESVRCAIDDHTRLPTPRSAPRTLPDLRRLPCARRGVLHRP